MTAEISDHLTGTARAEPIRYIRLPEVLDRVGASWITIHRWEKQGRFPKRRKLGHRLVGWVEAEVDAWCTAKAGSANAMGDS